MVFIMIGIIEDYIDEFTPAKGERPPIDKRVLIINLTDGNNLGVEFVGKLRKLVVNGFKIGDMVDVEYNSKTNIVNNQKGRKVYTNIIGKKITRL